MGETASGHDASRFDLTTLLLLHVALALLLAVVTMGNAYLFYRLGGFSGGVVLDEPLLPASSLTRNTRNRLA